MSKQLAVRHDPTYAPSVRETKKRSSSSAQSNVSQQRDGTSKGPRVAMPPLAHMTGPELYREFSRNRKHHEEEHARHRAEAWAQLSSVLDSSLPQNIHPSGSSRSAVAATSPFSGMSSAAQSQSTPRSSIDREILGIGESQQRGIRSTPGPALGAPVTEIPAAVPKKATSSAEAAANHRKDYRSLLVSPEPSRWSAVRPQYVDPMLQTSTRAKPAGGSLVGRPIHDGLLESANGMVLTEVELIALPFGGVIELANRYPGEVKEGLSDEGGLR